MKSNIEVVLLGANYTDFRINTGLEFFRKYNKQKIKINGLGSNL